MYNTKYKLRYVYYHKKCIDAEPQSALCTHWWSFSFSHLCHNFLQIIAFAHYWITPQYHVILVFHVTPFSVAEMAGII